MVTICTASLTFNNSTRVIPKLKPPILLYCPTTSEVVVGDMAVEVELSHQYSVKFCCHATDGSRWGSLTKWRLTWKCT